ncbi:MAG: type II toxin-antitoxin system PemK/MazF family toxin [Lewinellaceae bacterium]|nr:type II toxin-antitoxin system PemK/MazF family toxin [Saprospiraceae bacterium]MCB9337799.1 type II toxin-antitoxin system PemK/MazF family toxin [Lewinellaceae bacterium]
MKRSEIWLINLDPTIGAEIRKTRPAVIVNDDALGILPLKVIVPITDWKPNYAVADWMVKLEPNAINNLAKGSAADCFQVRSLSQLRMVRKIGELDDLKMSEIEGALAKVLRI